MYLERVYSEQSSKTMGQSLIQTTTKAGGINARSMAGHYIFQTRQLINAHIWTQAYQ